MRHCNFFFSFFFSPLTAPCQYLQVHSKQSRPKHPDGEEERRKDERGRCGVLGLVKKISSRKKVETLRKSKLDHIHILFWIVTTERFQCSYANVTLSIISNLPTLPRWLFPPAAQSLCSISNLCLLQQNYRQFMNRNPIVVLSSDWPPRLHLVMMTACMLLSFSVIWCKFQQWAYFKAFMKMVPYCATFAFHGKATEMLVLSSHSIIVWAQALMSKS